MIRAEPNQLKRVLGPWALIAYGVGDILGAGIYALVGKVAGLVGTACWLSFLIAFIVACLTGLSYCELGSRIPRSAGESAFVFEAFGKPLLSFLIGFLVLLSGIVSMATVSHGFAGYLGTMVPGLASYVIIFVFLVTLGLINFLGIRLSSWANLLCTAIEVIGISIVIIAGLKFFGRADYVQITPPPAMSVHVALLQGGVLAFYAFIGFEDMVNVAEETHTPERTLPRAIVISLGVTSVIYILTSIAAVSAVPVSELSSSSAPLVLVVEKGFPRFPPLLFTLIALFAVSNTALINFIMGSRILYGMAHAGLVPNAFGRVHPKTRTPHIAIGFVLVIALALALSGGIVFLAQSTSLLLLAVFLVMNLSLISLKIRRDVPRPPFQIPIVIPVLGALACFGLIFFVKPAAFIPAVVLIAAAIFLYRFRTVVGSSS